MKRILFPCLVLSVLFSSCIGVDSKITISRDGSGAITVQYRVPEELQALGELDGNESRPTVPVGQLDIRRGVDRIEGLSLESFSEKRDGRDRVYSLSLAFTSMDALTAFLNNSLGSAVLDRNSLSLSLSSGGKIDSDLSGLVRQQSSGYTFRLSVQSSLGGDTKKFEYEIPMDELLLSENPVRLDIEI
ncbi:MAG: hypothetical protein LBI85_07745 [Spirochaetaceae bacterium]|jgi:hypothetical protein|nr:hypothetical protein [Spirochaetaceae bacterium]